MSQEIANLLAATTAIRTISQPSRAASPAQSQAAPDTVRNAPLDVAQQGLLKALEGHRESQLFQTMPESPAPLRERLQRATQLLNTIPAVVAAPTSTPAVLQGSFRR